MKHGRPSVKPRRGLQPARRAGNRQAPPPARGLQCIELRKAAPGARRPTQKAR